MNYFFALEVPEEVRQELAEQVSRWRSEIDKILQAEGFRSYDWVRPIDYHITLKFLGDISEAAVERAVDAAQAVAHTKHPLKVRLAPAGSFTKNRTANAVLWMGVRHSLELEELAYALNDLVTDPNLLAQMSRPGAVSQEYKPHITMARGIFKVERLDYRMAYERSFPSWQATQFVLMQTLPPESRANGAKARYNIVHTFPFRTAHLSDVS